MRWALIMCAVCGLAACKQSAEPAPAPAAGSDRPVVSPGEVKRGQDACRAYVDKVCACAASHPDLQKECGLAKALPEAMQVALDVAKTADSTRMDVLQANDSMRKIVKECIEETAKLAATCP